MSRRKLTERQSALIKERQRSRIHRRGAAREAESADANLGPEQTGVVVANHGANLQVEDADRNVMRCTARQNLGDLVCGDRVLWRAAQQTGVVVALYPRDTELTRTDAYGNVQLVAANIDRLFIVAAPVPEVSVNLLDNYLVAAELSRITPVIIVNKSDLLDANARARWESEMEVYRRCGYTVRFMSTRDAASAAVLAEAFAAHCGIVVGHSGVGKSSLLRRVLPGHDIAVGDVSTAGLGKHTTTVARLYHLPGGGDVIDSPGVREFRLGHITAEQAAHGFVEFRSCLGRCKFRDCRHTVEPGCAVLEAMRAGSIDARRHRRYVELLDALKQSPRAPLT
jgi:ribosome biogenesis GTPase